MNWSGFYPRAPGGQASLVGSRVQVAAVVVVAVAKVGAAVCSRVVVFVLAGTWIGIPQSR